MVERLNNYKNRLIDIWNKTTMKQRIITISTAVFILVSLSIIMVVASKKEFVQLYVNLSEREAGEITARLNQLNIEYKLSPDGKGISVPSSKAPQLRLDLAAEGFPRSGSITYESFAQNMNFGLTDKQFSVVERDAMQNELRKMIIDGIKGVQNAQVMITLPQETIWVNQARGEATASIILDIEPGYGISQTQINALYTLVSKSIPNLPLENIIIANQYSEELVLDFANNHTSITGDFERFEQIRKQVEKDIQRDLQRLLGTMMQGRDYVVQVFASIDFTQETRLENLVTAPNQENQEGLIISTERNSENYQAEGINNQGGIVGPGATDIAGYQANEGSGTSSYEKDGALINYEVNRISRTIAESPYKIKDLSVNVAYEQTPADPNAPGVQVVDQTEQIEAFIKNIVRNVLSAHDPNLNEDKVANRVMVTPFAKAHQLEAKGDRSILLYSLAAVAVIAIGGVIILLLRQRRAKEEETFDMTSSLYNEPEVDLLETEESSTRKQLERLAREKPQDFVNLLRTWLTED